MFACQNAPKNLTSEDHYKKYHPFIVAHLSKGPMGVDLLTEKIDMEAVDEVTVAIQWMLAKGEVTYDKTSHLVLQGNNGYTLKQKLS